MYMCKKAQALLELHRTGQNEFHAMDYVIAMAHDAVVRQDKSGRLAVSLNRGDPGCLGLELTYLPTCADD